MAVPSKLQTLRSGLLGEVRAGGATRTVHLAGEWDLVSGEVAKTVIRDALEGHPETLVLDLSQVSFVDSTAIQTIVGLHQLCAELDVGLMIIPGPRAVARTFQICGLTDRLPFTAGTTGGGSRDASREAP